MKSQQLEVCDPYEFTPENVRGPEAIEKVLRDPDMIAQAGGNPTYLNHMRDERLAALRVAIDPTSTEAQAAFVVAHNALAIYNERIRLLPNIRLPKQ